MKELATLVVRDTESLVDDALIHIRTKYLYPEHLRKSFYLALCPFDETTRSFVLLEGREEPVCRVLNHREDGSREVIDVGPDMSVETNHANKSACCFRPRSKKCHARSGACIEAN